MRLQSVMQHSFATLPSVKIPRSTFDRSHGYKTAFDAGYLIPIYRDEALPGDTFSLSLAAVARLTTPLRPIMDNMKMDFHFFAVPIRLIWDNWQHFNGEQVAGSLDPVGSTDFICPVMNSGVGASYATGSLQDYLDLPVLKNNVEHVVWWTRAYNLIWNDWYRDQNLQDRVVVDTDDGPDAPADYVLLRRGKRHDYFTSCLPWPQKGDSVSIPLGTTAPVNLTSSFNVIPVFKRGSDHAVAAGEGAIIAEVATGQMHTTASGYDAVMDPNGSLYADLSTATAATINQLRQSFQVQKLYERDARGGTRYTEILRSHFGVISPDARLQRPEYLGGGSVDIVSQHTNSTNPTSPPSSLGFGGLSFQGNWPTHIGAQTRGIGFTKSFTEHCVLLGLVSVRADLTYQQGLAREWSRSTRWDFAWPELANIGEQAVLKKEIFFNNDANDNLVFGYIPRYDEYRFKPSRITGKLRSDAATSLDLWHLSQDFASVPSLNSSFIQENPPISRIVAVTNEPHFIYDSYISLKCARPLPVFGVPGLIDHF